MNPKFAVGIIVAVIVLAGLAFLLPKATNNNSSQLNEQEQNMQAEQEGTTDGSVDEILAGFEVDASAERNSYKSDEVNSEMFAQSELQTFDSVQNEQ